MFGFVNYRSTFDTIFALTNRIIQAQNKGEFAAGIFFNFERFLKKFESIG